ncbi:MAG: hypothetical protein Q4F43_04130, partial [Eubacteriales bacterium]|nr:hypothetical protein [Eubacteriales bacterium]
MKKNGNKPGKFIRFVAILCAAILTIQVLPAAMPVSVAVQASENEDSSSDKQAEEEKKKEEEEKKEEKKEEEK